MWTEGDLKRIKEETGKLRAENDQHGRPYTQIPEGRRFWTKRKPLLDRAIGYLLSWIVDRGVKEWEVDRVLAEREREQARWQCKHWLNCYGAPQACDQCVSEFKAQVEYAPAPPPDWHRDYRYGAPGPFHAQWCKDSHTGECLTETRYKKFHEAEVA